VLNAIPSDLSTQASVPKRTFRRQWMFVLLSGFGPRRRDYCKFLYKRSYSNKSELYRGPIRPSAKKSNVRIHMFRSTSSFRTSAGFDVQHCELLDAHVMCIHTWTRGSCWPNALRMIISLPRVSPRSTPFALLPSGFPSTSVVFLAVIWARWLFGLSREWPPENLQQRVSPNKRGIWRLPGVADCQ